MFEFTLKIIEKCGARSKDEYHYPLITLPSRRNFSCTSYKLEVTHWRCADWRCQGSPFADLKREASDSFQIRSIRSPISPIRTYGER